MATQNHIHLSTTIGGAPENAPSLKWTTVDRDKINSVIISPKRSLSGKLYTHVLESAGNPIVFKDMAYILVVKAEQSYTLDQREAQLLAMLGRTVYLVDHNHPADNADHTAYRRTMLFDQMGEMKKFDPALSRYYVSIHLTDNDTVP